MIHHRPTYLKSILQGVLGTLLLTVTASAEESSKDETKPQASPVLHLSDGGFVTGDLVDSDKPGVLRWQASAFTSPFVFDIKKVRAVLAPPPSQPPKPSGHFRFELVGGDLVFGNLAALDENEATLDIPRLGLLKIKRSGLLRMDRWSENADLIYLGPNGLNGWTASKSEKENAWHDESGELSTDHDGATIQADIGLPARAAIDFEISWKKTPDFVFSLGIDPTEKTVPEKPAEPRVVNRIGRVAARNVAETPNEPLPQGFRLEVWENDLVFTKEGEKDADVASVATVDDKSGRIHLRLLLDQEKGTLVAIAPDGKILVELSSHDIPGKIFPGIRLENKKGDVRLERLQVTHWNGETPHSKPVDSSNVLLVDGASQPGKVMGYDTDSNAFLIVDDGNEKHVPRDKVSRVVFSTVNTIPPRSIRVVYQDGSRLSGDLIKIEGGNLWLSNAVVAGPEKLSLKGLRALTVLQDPDAKAETQKQIPRLEMEGLKLTGTLVDGQNAPGASCLAWKPEGSSMAAALKQGLAGKIFIKEPVTATTPVQPNNSHNQVGFAMVQAAPARIAVNAPVAFLGGVVRAFGGNMNNGTPSTPTTSNPLKRALHLRTGDIIPASIDKIDEEGVTFKTTMSGKTFVPNDKVKAVELASEPAVTVRLNKPKRERLLTLPRAQKGSPPTHMIRSTNGDFLRGRLTAMDEKNLQVEIRLDSKPVPRDRVSRIIWLHPEEIVGPKPLEPDKAQQKDAISRVQAVRSDGIRLTFIPEKVAGTTISGKSDVLGECQVKLDEVDQLLIAGMIEKEAAKLVYQQWILKDAVEPKSAQDEGGDSPGGRSPGTESPLVGKPAPDFKLDLLDGKPFALADTKGHVVILDFWATWCGPCIQAMPQVEKVANEFKDRGVQLIAVNLQERPRDITPMLERHKFKMTVALDTDGVVAERYKANAIPQTVIIDRDGKVARLFVGSSSNLGDQLRDALKGVLDGAEKKEPAK